MVLPNINPMKLLLACLVAVSVSVSVYFFTGLTPQLFTMSKEIANDYSQVTGRIKSIDKEFESYDGYRAGISPRVLFFSVHYEYIFDEQVFTSNNFSVLCDWCREEQMKQISMRDSQKLEVGSDMTIYVNKYNPEKSWILKPKTTDLLRALLYLLACAVVIPLFIYWFACLWLSPLDAKKNSEPS